MKESRKFLSLAITLCLLIQQSGYCQPAGIIDLRAVFPSAVSGGSFFRPPHLRSIGYNGRYCSLLFDKGGGQKDLPSLSDSADALFRHFLVGVSLPNDSFWVNLRPDTPDLIIDSALAGTETGRVLLEADLQLKKDTAHYTSPAAAEGREYWKRIYARAEAIYGIVPEVVPTVARPWIVPGEVIIGQDDNSAYVYKAALEVRLREDSLKTGRDILDSRSEELNLYAAEQLRELVLPRLVKDVNGGKKYAALRQVYYSLVLAQWFKEKFRGSAGALAAGIDSGSLAGIRAAKPCSPRDYFEKYRESFLGGEYKFRQKTQAGGRAVVRTCASGGMEFYRILPAGISGLAPGVSREGPVSVITDERVRPEADYLVPGRESGGKVELLFSAEAADHGLRDTGNANRDGGKTDLSAVVFPGENGFNAFSDSMRQTVDRIVSRPDVQEIREIIMQGEHRGFFMPIGDYRKFLSGTGREIAASLGRDDCGRVAYNPMNSCDILVPFELTGATDVIAVSDIPFGDAAGDADKLVEASAFMAAQYRVFDGLDLLEYTRAVMKLSGLGAIAALRAALYMDAAIEGLYYFRLSEEGKIDFLVSLNAGGQKDNAVLVLRDKRTGERRKFWFVRHDLGHHEDNFSAFINSVRIDSLVIKAAFDLFQRQDEGMGYIDRENAIADILVPVKNQAVPAIVITDKRYSGKIRSPDQWYSMWEEGRDGTEPCGSVTLAPGRYFGYSAPGDRIFFGTADRLTGMEEDDAAGEKLSLDGGERIGSFRRALAVIKEDYARETGSGELEFNEATLAGLREYLMTSYCDQSGIIVNKKIEPLQKRLGMSANVLRHQLQVLIPSRLHDKVRVALYILYKYAADSPFSYEQVNELLVLNGVLTPIGTRLPMQGLQELGLVEVYHKNYLWPTDQRWMSDPGSVEKVNRENFRALYPDIDSWGTDIIGPSVGGPGEISEDYRPQPYGEQPDPGKIADGGVGGIDLRRIEKKRAATDEPEFPESGAETVVDAAREMRSIEALVSKRMRPSCERFMEVVAAAKLRGLPETFFVRARSCVAGLIRLDEDLAESTDPRLTALLWQSANSPVR